MSEKIRKITKKDIKLAMLKEDSLKQLRAFISKYEELTDDECEFKENWINEFYDCDTKDDVKNFMRDFTEDKLEQIIMN